MGGLTARVADQLQAVGALLPWMALIIVGATFVLLFFAFGSVVLPVNTAIVGAV